MDEHDAAFVDLLADPRHRVGEDIGPGHRGVGHPVLAGRDAVLREELLGGVPLGPQVDDGRDAQREHGIEVALVGRRTPEPQDWA